MAVVSTAPLLLFDDDADDDDADEDADDASFSVFVSC